MTRIAHNSMKIVDEFRLAASVPNYFKTIAELKEELQQGIWRTHKFYSRKSSNSYWLYLSGDTTRSAILDMLTPHCNLGNDQDRK
jgi:hypothetical protein